MIEHYISNKTITFLPLLALVSLFFFSSCSDSGNGPEELQSEIQAETVMDLHAPSLRDNPDARFVLFSFRSGQTVDIADSASTSWDVGFRGTEIILNSGISGPGEAGLVRLDVAFDQVTIAPSEGYEADGETLAMADWYTYTGMNEPMRAVFPNENETYVLRTADGNHYVKFDIISYYKGNPDTSTEAFANLQTRPASPFYTFDYVIQLEEGLRDLQ
ncbi:MAG: HmuY family protein [Balneolaceae bacterium]|nr:HmuY family protein [Balneolaceae bacterium]MDR9408765.1 HmuY family protein [Balneolaceae bacterium]